ncbi:MAG TPA: hypothetical protein VLB44_02730 [Kofleriaceae bacterium]|nr:hypothetical protein [Kofleriaceae bacterium]
MAHDDGFLNVDLEIGASSRAKLAPLVQELQGILFELFQGRIGRLYRAHYEILGCGPAGASATIHELSSVIEGLGGAGRRAWNAAERREFNVGVELRRGQRAVELAIDADAVRRVAALGGRVAFTAYQEAAMPKATMSKATKSRSAGPGRRAKT